MPPQNPSPQPDYGFIMEPPKPARRGLNLPGFNPGGSMLIRGAIALGGLLVLLIIFLIIKSLLSGGGNTQALITVGQDQQQMIHIITNGPGQAAQQAAQTALSPADQNFAATAQASLTSARHQLTEYMAKNGKKVSLKTLSAKLNPSIDQQLTSAAANTTYETTFKSIMSNQLKKYESDLRTAYNQTKGPKGRALLNQDYQGAQLLLDQLNSPAQ